MVSKRGIHDEGGETTGILGIGDVIIIDDIDL
jgi:hypothetical protein